MNKKIGFRNYDKDGSEEQNRQQAQEQAEDKAIAQFLSTNYSPIGATSQKCYKTTAELVYDLDNIVPVSPVKLAKQLSAAGYHVEYMAGQPYWVMYEKN